MSDEPFHYDTDTITSPKMAAKELENLARHMPGLVKGKEIRVKISITEHLLSDPFKPAGP